MSRKTDSLWIREDADRGKRRDAEVARKNRLEIGKALSHGEVSRRDLVKWGLFTSAGLIAPIGGLSPFVRSAHAFGGGGGTRGTGVPTGLPSSPTFGQQPFSAPLYRFDILPQYTYPGTFAANSTVPSIPVNPSAPSPAPTAQANTTQQPVNPFLVNGQTGLTGPIEGRPPGAIWAHQQFGTFPPQVAIELTTKDATANATYNPGVASNFNNNIVQTQSIPFSFNPFFPVQTNNSMWTFTGTVPPKLIVARYGVPIIFRHHNGLPFDVTQNGVNAFGRHTLTTHEHNGHHGAENDGFTGAYFFPGQFYDYHYPWTLAGWTTINTGATDPRAGAPDGNGHIRNVPGDYRETMSSHWYHDHMFTFTDQNVYKGIAGMTNIYSSQDRGNEAINDGVNLRLPSGALQDYANLQYDINLMVADKAWDANGQLNMDTTAFDGFLGDQMTINFCWKPFLQVYARKYRFRILNASVSRFFVFALSDSSTMVYIANDGNLLPQSVPTTQLDQLGIAERYDIIIDFSRYVAGTTLYLVNLQEQTDGKNPGQILSVSQAMQGDPNDPAVGPCLQFRVIGAPPQQDQSVIPATLIPNPTLPTATNTRTFTFDRHGQITTNDPVTTYTGNGQGSSDWGIATQNGGTNTSRQGSDSDSTNRHDSYSFGLGNGNNDANATLLADFGRITSAPTYGTTEVWTLVNAGRGWDHPIHIHFEEGQILARNGSASQVPAWEKGRKDVYRLHPGGSVTLAMQFRDWGGMFMEHCHNTMHEDNAMLMRWEINNAGGVFLNPLPTPIPAPTGVTFEAPDEILAGAFPPYNSTTNGSATGSGGGGTRRH
jgi:FtsP/CotA-like multicopper oxidase with cupredoxin domain